MITRVKSLKRLLKKQIIIEKKFQKNFFKVNRVKYVNFCTSYRKKLVKNFELSIIQSERRVRLSGQSTRNYLKNVTSMICTK